MWKVLTNSTSLHRLKQHQPTQLARPRPHVLGARCNMPSSQDTDRGMLMLARSTERVQPLQQRLIRSHPLRGLLDGHHWIAPGGPTCHCSMTAITCHSSRFTPSHSLRQALVIRISQFPDLAVQTLQHSNNSERYIHAEGRGLLLRHALPVGGHPKETQKMKAARQIDITSACSMITSHQHCTSASITAMGSHKYVESRK